MTKSVLENGFPEEEYPQVVVGAIGLKPAVNLGTRARKAPSKQTPAGVSVAPNPMGKRLYPLKEAASALVGPNGECGS